jgi:thioredoxin 2
MSDPLVFRCAACGGVNRVRPDRLASGPTCGRCHKPLDLAAHPADVDDDAVESLVRSSPVPVLVDLWAAWCGPCRAVAPHLVELARRHAGKLIVVKLDVDRHKRVAGALQVQAIPTLALAKGGQFVKVEAGARMGPELEAFATS